MALSLYLSLSLSFLEFYFNCVRCPVVCHGPDRPLTYSVIAWRPACIFVCLFAYFLFVVFLFRSGFIFVWMGTLYVCMFVGKRVVRYFLKKGGEWARGV